MDGNAYRDTASRYSYLYLNAHGHISAAHGVANDNGSQYAYRAVVDPDADADAASKRHLHAHCLARGIGRGSSGGASR